METISLLVLLRKCKENYQTNIFREVWLTKDGCIKKKISNH